VIKPPITYTESRAIPVAITRYILWREKGMCFDGCGSPGKQQDHRPAWNLLIPKRHDPDKIFLVCKACHSEKSKKDTTEAARAKRLGKKHTGEIKPKGMIKSRGFDKSKRKKLNGKVEAR